MELTRLGKERLRLVVRYDLESYYNPYIGSMIFRIDHFRHVQDRVAQFLQDNTGWVLGYDFDGNEHFIYVTPIENLE